MSREQEAGTVPRVDVYTDGGCDPNPGPGGWAAIIRLTEADGRAREWTLFGNDPDTTNNRMEMQAAAAALALLEGMFGRCRVTLYTDSQYLRQGVTEWLAAWVERGWRTVEKEPVKNQDLWRLLHRLTQAHEVTWRWLQGHAGHPDNERADRLATEARQRLSARPQPAPRQAQDARRPAVEICVKAAGYGAQGGSGWGAVLRMGEHTRTLSGGEPSTTANAALLHGAAEALRALKQPCRVTLYSDADYLIKGASMWVKGWQARQWQTKEGKPVANRPAWEALLEAARPHHVAWVQVAEGDVRPDMLQAGELAAAARQTVAAVPPDDLPPDDLPPDDFFPDVPPPADLPPDDDWM